MSLLNQIQSSIVDPAVAISSCLLRCKLLASQLESEALAAWLEHEASGYPDKVELPPYRVWPLSIRGHFAGPFGSGIRNANIPRACIPKELRDTFTKFYCRSSIATIENTVREHSNDEMIAKLGDLWTVLGTSVFQDQNCIAAWGNFSAGQFVELLNTVRHRLLDFTIALGKSYPGLLATGNAETKVDPHRVDQIFNIYVGGSGNSIVASGPNSSVKVRIRVQAANKESVASTLADAGVDEGDIRELLAILDKEPTPPRAGAFGSGVSGWMARMVEKAATGAWGIGINAAGGFLAQVISAFYGIA